MDDQDTVEYHKRRYLTAQHAMQTGVGYSLNYREETPKDVRVGINTALVDIATLIEVLIDKGIIDEVEMHERLADGMEREVKRYEEHLTALTGVKTHLG